MTLVNNGVSEFCSGYDEIIDAHIRIKEAWRDRLFSAYGRKRLQYDAAKKEYLKRHQEIKQRAMRSLGLITILFVLALAAFYIDAWAVGNGFGVAIGLLLIAGGLFVGLNFTLIWLRHRSQCPQPPSHPSQVAFIPPLLPAWKKELKGKLPNTMEYDGAVGEYDFVRQLQQNLSSLHYIIYRLQQKRGDDIDVIVVGPSGVWAFEVKYWAGSIMWRDGQWRRERTHFETGGVPVTENPIVSQPPDEQWRRMAGDVAKSIRIQAPQLVSRYLTGIRTQGGVVFTHPKATCNIAPNHLFEWGDISTWTRKIVNAPRISGWDERTTFMVLDALFTRHHQVVTTFSPKSMHSVGKQLIQQTEKDLAAWINS